MDFTEMTSSAMPFILMKMLYPLNVLLACPALYARPALPLPARSALLKFGRLKASKLKVMPFKRDMPTSQELMSFRLEFCVPPIPGSDLGSCKLKIVLKTSSRNVANPDKNQLHMKN